MDSVFTSLAWCFTAVGSFVLGWRLCVTYESWRREALEKAALEDSALEYERGFQQGYETGVDVTCRATRQLRDLNQERLMKLAEARFVVGGRMANE